ncbi:MAG: sugar kinase [Armatimonadetes bacterium]|jgi:sugar/nucleoside kinase (ribokinase family)|nr:sugar kinase [Armatimonadota bacterium]
MTEVTCLGILVADVVGKPVDVLPDRGKLMLVDRMELHGGGCANSTGIGLSRLGIKTAVIGKVGRDGFGDFMVDNLTRNGVDCAGVVRDDSAATSATMVLVHGDGERSFIHYIGANGTLTEQDVNFDVVKSSKALHIAGSFLLPGFDGEPTARVLKKAREMGVITSLDTAWDSRGNWMKLLEPCLQYLDYAVPSIEEARMVTGKHEPADVAAVLMDKGVGTVALKMGDQGCYIRSKDLELSIPIYKVDVVDALGAGDAFAAGFLTGIVNGWDLERTGKFANATGAFCVTALGATTGIKDQNTIEAFIAARESGDKSK